MGTRTTNRSFSMRSWRVGRNQVAKLWGFTRRSVCWRTLSQRVIKKCPHAISTGVEILWKPTSRDRRPLLVWSIGLDAADRAPPYLQHVDECSRSIVFCLCTRGGILPKRNAMSKRKLNEVMLRVSHRIHSFSTARFSSCFRRNFVGAISFRRFSKALRLANHSRFRFPQARPAGSPVKNSRTHSGSAPFCRRCPQMPADECRVTSFLPRNRGENSGAR